MAPAEKKQTTRAARTKAAGEVKHTAKGARAPRNKAVKAAAPQVRLVLQYMGWEISQAEMAAAAADAWRAAGGNPAAIQTMDLYVKPEDNAVYYVINGASAGKVPFSDC